MTPQEIETLRPFILPGLVLTALTAVCAVATAMTFLWGIVKSERHTWRFHAVVGTCSGCSTLFYVATSAVMEYAASQLGYDAEWTLSVLVQYLIGFALLSFLVYVSVKHLRLAAKGYYLEEDKKSENN